MWHAKNNIKSSSVTESSLQALSLVISRSDEVELELLMLTSQRAVTCESPSPLFTAVREWREADAFLSLQFCHNLSNQHQQTVRTHEEASGVLQVLSALSVLVRYGFILNYGGFKIFGLFFFFFFSFLSVLSDGLYCLLGNSNIILIQRC